MVAAVSSPFVQGRLRQEDVTATVETVCAKSGRPLTITISSNMEVEVRNEGAKPLVFFPQFDWKTFAEPNIIDVY